MEYWCWRPFVCVVLLGLFSQSLLPEHIVLQMDRAYSILSWRVPSCFYAAQTALSLIESAICRQRSRSARQAGGGSVLSRGDLLRVLPIRVNSVKKMQAASRNL